MYNIYIYTPKGLDAPSLEQAPLKSCEPLLTYGFSFWVLVARYGCFHKVGAHFGSPYNKDHNIFGSILGPPIYGSPHMHPIRGVDVALLSGAAPTLGVSTPGVREDICWLLFSALTVR